MVLSIDFFCGNDSVNEVRSTISIEASPIEPVANDNQRDDCHEYNGVPGAACSEMEAGKEPNTPRMRTRIKPSRRNTSRRVHKQHTFPTSLFPGGA